eukprot:scaffold7173_cov91-Skeletonema_menzelii.AAC.1
MKCTTLLLSFTLLLHHHHPTNAAEYHICGTSYMNAELNCLTNPKCFNGDIAVGTPPDDCPEEFPTCFTIISTEVLCGGGGVDIQTGGDTAVVTVPDISDPMLIEPIADDQDTNGGVVTTPYAA